MKMIPAAVRAGLRLIDHALDFYYRPVTFSEAPGCILQLSRGHASRDVQLRDGMTIAAGTPVLALHFWNERLSEWATSGLSVGPMMVGGLRMSLRELATYLAAHPEYDDLTAIVGEIGLFPGDRTDGFREFMKYLGWEVFGTGQPGWNMLSRTFWDNAFSWGMMWTYNPTSLANKRFKEIERHQIWASRDQLMKRYGQPRPSRTSGLPA